MISNTFKKTIGNRLFLGAAILTIGFLLTAGPLAAGSLEDAAAFYKGKNVELIVPNKPGGGYDAYCRLLAPYLEKYLGANVIVNNMPGAGGMLSVNDVYNARPNGLKINIQNTMASVTNQLVELKGIDYDLLKYSWIGRVTTDRRVLAMRKGAPVNTIQELIDSPKTVKLGATGLGGSTYVDAVISKEALNLPIEVVYGYDSSSEIDLGLLRGEIDGTYGSYNSRRSMVSAGEQFIILQSGKKRADYLPDVPTWLEVAATENSKKLLRALNALHESGRTLSTTPGVAPERLAFLRQAFDRTMKDPEFIADAQKAKKDLDYLSGEEVRELMKEILDIDDPAVKQKFVTAVKGEI